MGRISLRLLTTVTAAVALALPAGADAVGSPIPIGTNTMGQPSQAAVAVDSSGTAYIAWVVPGATPSAPVTQMDFCKVPLGATGCTPVPLPLPTGGRFFDPPSLLLASGDVYVFENVNGATNNHQNGVDEYVSTDGGASFTLDPGGAAVSNVNTEGAVNPVIALPGSNIGVGWVDPGGNPLFQANSLTAPADYSLATAPSPFATINPSPNNFVVGNLGGQFASQLTGAEGVLGVFQIIETGPCPSNSGLVFVYAPLSATTTDANINTSTGLAGSPWAPLGGVDCTDDNPAVGGGLSGLGLLDDNYNTGITEYRRFTPPSTFGAPVTVAAGSALDSTLSQDGGGGIYATMLNDNGLQLAYSSTGGATWNGPKTLLTNNGGALSIDSAASSVNASGQGWAVYAANGGEYAQPFTKVDAITVTPPPPLKPPTNTAPPMLGGTAAKGQTLQCSTGTWTGNPTFTYQWYRNGTLLAGVTGPTYKVGELDEGSTFKCVVTATNAAGVATATTSFKTVKIPFVRRCPAATGKMSGTQIGLLKLGMTRKHARFVYRRHSNRGKQYQDFFCLTPMGVRAGYATPKLLKKLSKHERKAVNGRVVWASTSNPFYELDGVRAGESITTAAKALKTGRPFHIGKNYWYLARKHGFTAVLKVRGVAVQELGIADNGLTKTRNAQSLLMHSFY